MRSSLIWVLALAVPMATGAEHSGVKMTSESVVAGNTSTRTSYSAGDRMRVEYRNSFGGRLRGDVKVGPRMARIVRCDLGESYELNLDAEEYTSAPYPPKPLTADEMKARGMEPGARLPGAPTIRVEIKTVDTGERKEMFGHAARHVITTSTSTPLEGSQSEPHESVTDGWYIDFDQRLACDAKPAAEQHGFVGGYVSAGVGRRPMEKPEFVKIGAAETGLALVVTMKSKRPSALPDATVSSFETRVTEFAEGAVDPGLFEIPAGFKRVEKIERYPAAGTP